MQTRRDAKEWLNSIKTDLEELYRLRVRREELTIEIAYVTGIDYSGDKVDQGSIRNPLEVAGWKLLEKREEFNKRIMRLMDSVDLKIDLVCKLPRAEQVKVLYLRYVKMMPIQGIADYCGYSFRHVERIHAAGIKAVQAALDDVDGYKDVT